MRARVIFLQAKRLCWLALAISSKPGSVMRSMKDELQEMRESRSWSWYLASFISLKMVAIFGRREELIIVRLVVLVGVMSGVIVVGERVEEGLKAPIACLLTILRRCRRM
jgi:hypothetical protein